MPHATFIYDAVRTPRAKGKPGGSLHPIKPLRLISDLLTALQTRNDLDTSKVNDVILGCSQPLGEQGGAIGKSAALLAGWADSVAGCNTDRFCGSGLEAINMPPARLMLAREEMTVARSVASMPRLPHAPAR